MNSSPSNNDASEGLPGGVNVSDTQPIPLYLDPIPSLYWQTNESLVPSMATWNITKEQLDLFFRLIEDCTGLSPVVRVQGLHVIRTDPRIAGILPVLATFIGDTMTHNLAAENLEFICHMLRMIRALLSNTLELGNYVHLLLPALLGCLTADQICSSPGTQNHWAARKYASCMVAELVCRYFYTLPTVIEAFKDALVDESLTTVYGGIAGLGRLGELTVRNWVVPQLKYLSGRIEPYLTPGMKFSSVSLKTLAAKCIRRELADVCAASLLKIHSPEDGFAEYKAAYGFLGIPLFVAVIRERINMMQMAAQTL